MSDSKQAEQVQRDELVTNCNQLPTAPADAALDCVRELEENRKKTSHVRANLMALREAAEDGMAIGPALLAQWDVDIDRLAWADALLAQGDAGATQHSTKEASDGR